MKTVFQARSHGTFEEIKSNLRRKKLQATNQGFDFVEVRFSNRMNVRAPIQFSRER